MEARTMRAYENFALRIASGAEGGYTASVLGSPAGEASTTIYLPADLYEPGGHPASPNRSAQDAAAPSDEAARNLAPAPRQAPPKNLGETLFDALFTGSVRSLLDQSLGMMHGQERGLRIRLQIDPADPALAPLVGLPWEQLYRREDREFLSLSSTTPVVRYLEVPQPGEPLSFKAPLRILVALASPAGATPLDLEKERALIEANWATHDNVQVHFLERASFQSLQEELSATPYHVLHYMGHGDFDEQAGTGVLLLENEGGAPAPVSGSELGEMLRDRHDRPTRLVFLNACETARSTAAHGLDPFSGVASALVRTGIPAVVAMQRPISDGAAIAFASGFYPLLAEGYPVDAAVTEGRQAIKGLHRTGPDPLEWATPVLFMRSPDGVLFSVKEAGALTLDRAWWRLTRLWLLGAGVLGLFLVVFALGTYRELLGGLFGWAALAVLPALLWIAGGWKLATRLRGIKEGEILPKRRYFTLARVLSLLYLGLVLLTLFLEPLTPFDNPLDWLTRSFFWLLPLQAAVIAAAAALLFSRRDG